MESCMVTYASEREQRHADTSVHTFSGESRAGSSQCCTYSSTQARTARYENAAVSRIEDRAAWGSLLTAPADRCGLEENAGECDV